VTSTGCPVSAPAIYPGFRSPGTSNDLPVSALRRAGTSSPVNQHLFDLSARKVYHAFPVARKPVGSYSTFSPLPRHTKNMPGRYFFCGTCCQRTVTSTLPSR